MAKVILWTGLLLLLQALDTNVFFSGNDRMRSWFKLYLMLVSSEPLILHAIRGCSQRMYVFIRNLSELSGLLAVLMVLLASVPDLHSSFLLHFSILFNGILGIRLLLIALALLSRIDRGSLTRMTIWLSVIMSWFYLFQYTARPGETYGDEPHYLLMTHSLLNDGDLNLIDEYSDEDYRPFYPHHLDPKPSDLVTDTEIRSRGLGFTFSVILIPAYWVAGYAGVSVFMIFLTVLLLVQTFRFYCDVTDEPRIAFAIVLILGTTIPILLYAYRVYPDIAGALIIVTCLRLLSSSDFIIRRKHYPLLLVMLSGLLILLKFRFFFPSIVLLVAGLALLKSRPRRMLQYGFVAGLVVMGYFVVDVLLFHGELFARRFGEIDQLMLYLPDLASFGVIPGIFLDQESGIIWLAPVFLMVIPGIRLWSRPRSAVFWCCCLILPLTIVSLLGHAAWHSLPTPPLRYMIPALPAISVFMVSSLRRYHEMRISLRLFLSLCILFSYLIAFALIVSPDWQNNYADGTAKIFEAIAREIDIPLTSVLPSLTRPSLIIIPWIIVLSVIVVHLWRRHRYRIWQLEIPMSRLVVAALTTVLAIGGAVSIIYPNDRIDAEDEYLSLPEAGYRYPINPDPFYHHYERHGWVLPPGASLQPAFRTEWNKANLVVSAKLLDSSQPVRVNVIVADRAIAYFDVTSFYWQDYLVHLPGISDSQRIICRVNDKQQRDVVIDSMRIIERAGGISDILLRCSELFHSMGWDGAHFFALQQGLMRSPFDVNEILKQHFNPSAVRMQAHDTTQAKSIDAKHLDRIVEWSTKKQWDKLFYFERLFNFTAIRSIDPSLLRNYLIDEIKYGPGLPNLTPLLDYRSRFQDDIDIQIALAIGHYKRGEFYKMIQIFEQIIEQFNCPEATLSSPGALKTCSKQFIRLLNEITDSTEYRKAVEAFLGGRMHDALSVYSEQNPSLCIERINRLIRLDPDYVKEWLLVQRQEISRIVLPQMAFQSPSIFLELTEEFLRLRRNDEALIGAEKALSLDPSSSAVRLTLARTLFARGDLDEARQQCLVGMTLSFDNDASRNALEVILNSIELQSRQIGQPTATNPEEL